MKSSNNIEDVYTLSPLQEGMLFHSIYQKGASAYFVQSTFRLSGDLKEDLVELSLQKLVDRHDILRTSFVYEEMDKPLQIVLREKKMPFHFEDIRTIGTAEEKEAYITQFKKEDRAKYFDLSKDCLMRASIFRLNDLEYEFIWSCHHIIIDGWCLKTLEYEFFTFYEGAKKEEEVVLPPAPQYKNYIKWLSEQSHEDSIQYWTQYLKDYSSPVGIPKLLSTSTPTSAFENQVHIFELEEELNQNYKD